MAHDRRSQQERAVLKDQLRREKQAQAEASGTPVEDFRGKERIKTLNERPDWEADALRRLRRLNEDETW